MTHFYALEGPGTYGHQAMKQMVGKEQVIHFSRSNSEIVERVVREDGVGIVPVFNPYGGDVKAIWRAITQHHNSLINAGSVIWPLDHALVRRIGAQGKVKRIFSHQQAHDQSELKLKALYPGHEFVSVESTIGALDDLHEDGDAAICSARGIRVNAELRGKFFIEQEHMSPPDNKTSFLLIATLESAIDILNIAPSQLDILQITLQDTRGNLAVKLALIALLTKTTYEWGKQKLVPGSPLYTLLLITSKIPRNRLNNYLLQMAGIQPLRTKEDLKLG